MEQEELEGDAGKEQKGGEGKVMERMAVEESGETRERDARGGVGVGSESLGRSEAALSVSVAAQSGLLSP